MEWNGSMMRQLSGQILKGAVFDARRPGNGPER